MLFPRHHLDLTKVIGEGELYCSVWHAFIPLKTGLWKNVKGIDVCLEGIIYSQCSIDLQEYRVWSIVDTPAVASWLPLKQEKVNYEMNWLKLLFDPLSTVIGGQ